MGAAVVLTGVPKALRLRRAREIPPKAGVCEYIYRLVTSVVAEGIETFGINGARRSGIRIPGQSECSLRTITVNTRGKWSDDQIRSFYPINDPISIFILND